MDFYYWGIVNLFSPPYGDSTMDKMTIYESARLSPPYGDGIKEYEAEKKWLQFSPPYGDCSINDLSRRSGVSLSPPCGDGILNISQNTAKLKSWMARKYSLY